jgi:hypothetical protein
MGALNKGDVSPWAGPVFKRPERIFFEMAFLKKTWDHLR